MISAICKKFCIINLLNVSFFIVFSFSLFFFSGCLPYGLPEQLALIHSGEIANSRTKPKSSYFNNALIIQDSFEEKCREGQCTMSLGSQFLFGVVPWTQVYFQHGAQSFLDEMVLEELLVLGFRGFSVNSRWAQIVSSVIKPYSIYKFNLDNVSLNAYDMFLLRMAVSSGVLNVESLAFPSGVKMEVIHKFSQDIYRRNFLYFPNAPELSWIFKESLSSPLSKVMSEAFDSVSRTSRLSRIPKTKVNTPILIILLPSISSDAALRFGKSAALSYGFASQPAYLSSQVSRIFQRGLQQGSDEAEVPNVAVMEALSSSECLLGMGSPEYWQLSSYISEPVPQSDIFLERDKLSFRFRFVLSVCNDMGFSVILNSECVIQENIADKTDGSWVVTSERAAARAISGLLNAEKGFCHNES